MQTRPGQLRDAIYHVYADQLSSDGHAVYRVSWNAKKAPHGHLIEYGHWRGLEGRAVPVLDGARASFDCEVAHVHDWATHHIVIGTVRAVQLAPDAQPSLVYADGQYRAVG